MTLSRLTNFSIILDPEVLQKADFIIIAVPTPVDLAHQPDLMPLIESSETVGKNLKPGAIIVFESHSFSGRDRRSVCPSSRTALWTEVEKTFG